MPGSEMPHDLSLLAALKPFVSPLGRKLIDTLMQVTEKQVQAMGQTHFDAVASSQVVTQEIRSQTADLISLGLVYLPLYLANVMPIYRPRDREAPAGMIGPRVEPQLPDTWQGGAGAPEVAMPPEGKPGAGPVPDPGQGASGGRPENPWIRKA